MIRRQYKAHYGEGGGRKGTNSSAVKVSLMYMCILLGFNVAVELET